MCLPGHRGVLEKPKKLGKESEKAINTVENIMSKKKSVHLGQGVRLEVFYEQLKKKLENTNLRLSEKLDVLRKAFPEEAAEERQRKERLIQKRWLDMETGSDGTSLPGDHFSNRGLFLRAAALPPNLKESDSYRVTDFPD